MVEVNYDAQFDDFCDLCLSVDGYHLPVCPRHPEWDETVQYGDADEFYVDPMFDFDADLEG